MNRRDFIGGALAPTGGAAFGDEYVATKRGCTPRELPYAELKRQLVANGVFV